MREIRHKTYSMMCAFFPFFFKHTYPQYACLGWLTQSHHKITKTLLKAQFWLLSAARRTSKHKDGGTESNQRRLQL